ncbi:SGNH hydrolase [Sodiomyces alkalinus F11]|uniref:SGNH hydrolase n=1 Tax=Sodiomyces alkalinus (strain CBS 110278 / VKM F-3762 / F11) TaxID=1314773 RepID=A0A3N2Q689_SODAK|nr:SGNH hydrolase [Sodiomyces alkalinus F11]ROT42217.1 SGNH hydrolase [Sodiomyces alkalinus F11]
MLVDEGLADVVDFVGSMNNNPQNCVAQSGSFDLDHEGHSGWLAIDIANQHLQGWLASTKPDIVQFMLGTNDVFQGRATGDIVAAYTRMVDLMRASNAEMRIIVDLVIPIAFGSQGVNALNAQIPGWAQRLDTPESPIEIADCSANAGYTTGMLRDGVHPNAEGDALIARQVGPILIEYVRELAAERGFCV